MIKSSSQTKIWKINTNERVEADDVLAIEEPLEIQLAYGKPKERKQKSISITMRTPGNDFDLAAGFLFTESIITSAAQIKQINFVESWNPELQGNKVLVELDEAVEIDFKKLERHFYTSSSCGVCGKTSIEAVRSTQSFRLAAAQPIFDRQVIHELPNRQRAQQQLFEDTGGIHAAALFDTAGKLILLREDVGRHNAVDKLVGAALLKEMLPLSDYLILVSGRASFELIQKSLVAGIPILAAVGAPSSLAISLAKEAQMTVLGFVRNNRFNIYCGEERIS